jgi:hypothetical protein
MKLTIAIFHICQAPKVEDLTRGESAHCDEELTGEANTII